MTENFLKEKKKKDIEQHQQAQLVERAFAHKNCTEWENKGDQIKKRQQEEKGFVKQH